MQMEGARTGEATRKIRVFLNGFFRVKGKSVGGREPIESPQEKIVLEPRPTKNLRDFP